MKKLNGNYTLLIVIGTIGNLIYIRRMLSGLFQEVKPKEKTIQLQTYSIDQDLRTAHWVRYSLIK